MSITRRTFSQTVGLGLVGAALPAWAQNLNIPIGHTGITWPWGNMPNTRPPKLSGPEPIEQVVADLASLGYRGIELFAWQIDGMEAYGGLGPVLQRHKLALIGSYTGVNLTDAGAAPGDHRLGGGHREERQEARRHRDGHRAQRRAARRLQLRRQQGEHRHHAERGRQGDLPTSG